MKKAQLNQVFITIFALLIIGLVALFSAKGIGSLFENKCDADFVAFKNDLKGVVGNKDYGVIKEHRMLAPCSYQTMCIISGDVTGNINLGDVGDLVGEEMQTLMSASIVDGQLLKNIFLSDGDVVVDAGLIPEFRLSSDDGKYVCISRVNGRFNFHTYGKGPYLEIKIPSSESSSQTQTTESSSN